MIRSTNNKEFHDEDWSDLIAGYVLGNLTDKEAEDFRQQLEKHPDLSKEVAAFQATADLIPYALPQREPPAGLKGKLLAAAAQLDLVAAQNNAVNNALHVAPQTRPRDVSSDAVGSDVSETVDTSTGTSSEMGSGVSSEISSEISFETERSHLISPRNAYSSSTVPRRQPPRRASRFNSQFSSRLDQWLSLGLSNGLLTGASTGVAALAIAAVVVTSGKLSSQSRQTASLQQQLDNKIAEIESLRAQLQETQAVTAFLGERATQVHALVDAKRVGATGETAKGVSEDVLPTARLLAKAGDREIVFVAQDLPQLPSEQIYRLWAVADENAEPTYCGQFRQDESGAARWEAPDIDCTNAPKQLLITLDAPDDPITSAGRLVLQTQVEGEV